MKTSANVLLSVLLLTLCSVSFADESSLVRNKVSIETDKNIYAQNEPIFLYARVNPCNATTSSAEGKLTIALVGADNQRIIEKQIDYKNGFSIEQLIVPSSASDGFAYLLAYTTNTAVNEDIAMASICPIIINSLEKNDMLIDITSSTVDTGGFIVINLSMKHMMSSSKKEPISVSSYNSNNEKTSEIKTSITEGNNEIKIPYTPNDKTDWIEITSSSKNFCFKRIYISEILSAKTEDIASQKTTETEDPKIELKNIDNGNINFVVNVEDIVKHWPNAEFDITVVDKHALFCEYDDSWNQLTCDKPFVPKKNIGGKVVGKKNDPLAGVKVVIVDARNGESSTITTDKDGLFSLENVDAEFVSVIRLLEGNKKAKVLITDNFKQKTEEIAQKASLSISQIYDKQTITGYYEKNRDIIDQYFQENKSTVDQQNQKITRMLESGSSILDVIRTLKSYEILDNQIVFSGTHNSLNYQSGALIVLDGQKLGTDIGAFDGISTHDIESINVSTSAMDIHKYTGLNSVGIIEIYTKGYFSSTRLPNVNEIGNDEVNENKKTHQTTRLWIPAAQASSEGKIELSFKTEELKTEFAIRVKAFVGTDKKAEAMIFYKE